MKMVFYGEWESEYLSYVGTTKCYFRTQNISTNIVYAVLLLIIKVELCYQPVGCCFNI